MQYRLGCSLIASVAIACSCLGCGNSPVVSGSLDEATVSGVVRLHGKPVDNGTVVFNTANVNRPSAPPREAPIGKDGSYTITTLLGENNVVISCRQFRSPRNARYAEDEHFVKVEPGSNTFNIEIPPRTMASQ